MAEFQRGTSVILWITPTVLQLLEPQVYYYRQEKADIILEGIIF